MSNPRVAVLTDEFTKIRTAVDALDQLAADEKRDLTDEERPEYDANLTRMETIAADIEKIEKRSKSLDAVAEATTRSTPAPARTSPRSPVEVPSLGEQIKVRALHSLGKSSDSLPDYETLTRVLDHGVFADGIQPVTIEGNLVSFVDANRYAVNAARRLPMPDNKSQTFKRPKKTTTTTVAVQAAQGDVLSSRAAEVQGTTVTKATFGGTVALSEQELDWTDPAMLAVTVEDLAEQYAVTTDNALCDAIETASTASVQTVVSLTAASDVQIKAIAAATAVAYGTSGKLPDTYFVSVDRWAYLLGLCDGDGRPLFPVANVINSAGTNPAGVTGFTGFNILGLNVVVDPNFTSGFQAVAVSQLVEVYEQNKGLLQIAAPSTLETVIAYRGYFATNVYTQGFGALEQS